MQKANGVRRVGQAAAVTSLSLVLAGCALPPLGDLRPGAGTGAPAAAPAPAPGSADAIPTTSEAEAACVARGRAQGLDVQSVVGSRVQRDADEQPIARDVMLRVASQGQVFDLRCNYRYASAEARIMSL